jgi:tetratricopeptide (TPR) repeat protein
MSPEQIAGNPAEIDTRSDVDALGVILYELLTGHLPYDLGQKPIIEAARVIRESAPRRMGHTSWSLRGDPETIALRALEKDKQRRYQSAAELGADLGRLLRREPIAARPPSAIYILRKFAARHRALVAAAVLLALVVLGALGAVTLQWKRARAEAAKSAATVDFLEKVLTSPDPAKTKGRDMTVREMLDQAAEQARLSPPAEPEVQVAVLDLIGTSYRNIGALTKAEELLKAAAQTAEERLGPDSMLRYNSLNTLGLVYTDQGRMKEAGELIMLCYQADLRLLGENHKDTLAGMNNAARWLGSQGRYDEAIPLMEKAVKLRTNMFGPDHQRTLISVDNLGHVLLTQGRAAEAEPYFRRAFDGFQRTLGPDNPDTLTAMQNLAEDLRKLNRLDEAERFERNAVAGRRRVLGDDNSFTLSSINYLGRILMDQNRLDAAEPVFREAVERAERTLGHDHQYTVGWRIGLGTCLGKLGRFADAEAALLDCYRGATSTPENASRVKPAVDALVALYESANRPDDATAWRAKAPANP